MDEGVVALVAAGVGLVGAIGGAAIGGFAAARGTRLGAETAAQATVRQVHDQSIAEHEHWLRERRLETCTALLAAYHRYAIQASALHRALEDESAESAEVGGQLRQCITDFRNTCYQVRLVATEDIREDALQLQMQVEDHIECIDEWFDAFLSNRGGAAVAEARAREERAREQLATLHTAFMEAARRSVSRRPVADRADQPPS
ncbi:hypothetical protein GCM10009536_08390 [Streptomyces thermocarboxydus]